MGGGIWYVLCLIKKQNNHFANPQRKTSHLKFSPPTASLQITLGNIFALPRKAGSGSLITSWMPLLRPQPSFATSTSNGACEPNEECQSCCLTTLIVDLKIDWRWTSLLLKRNSCALNADMFKTCPICDHSRLVLAGWFCYWSHKSIRGETLPSQFPGPRVANATAVWKASVAISSNFSCNRSANSG